MNIYTTDKIRNVVLLGHGGCGKTSLAEAMAYLAGLTNRMGTVVDGNTISDYDKEENKRQFSIHTSVIPIPWGDVKVNILDTPGYFDFVGEVEEAVSVADAAIIVVSGKAGIETGTKRAWKMCEKYKLPRMIFVTDMDIDNASYRQVVEDLQELYGKKIAPFHLPIRENEQFVGYVMSFSRKQNAGMKREKSINLKCRNIPKKILVFAEMLCLRLSRRQAKSLWNAILTGMSFRKMKSDRHCALT